MQEAKTVPKFASFKAKPTPATEDVKARRVDEERQHRKESSRHKSRHHSHRQRSHSRERRSSQHNSNRQDDDTLRDVVPLAPTNPESETQDFFQIDRKGDIHNVIYGTIHRYSIPQYRRAGRGGILGLPARFKIDRNYDGDDALLIRTDSSVADSSRHKTKSILSRADTRERNILRFRKEQVPIKDDAFQNFIPLDSDGSRKRQRILGGDVDMIDVSADDEEAAERYGYRSIHGKAKPEQDIPSDMEASVESSSDEEATAVKWNREANQKNSELLKHAEENPLDVEGWLAVISYQNNLMTGSNAHRQLTTAEKRSLADIRLSLYEKALVKVGKQHPEKDRLLLGYLQEGAHLWDSKRLSEQWHAILKHNPGYISLWVRYIDFRQTAFLDFTFDRCKEIYLECMKLNISSSESSEDKEMIHMYLFLRATLFMREAGFAELATGLWQAALEMCLFRPQDLLNSSKNDVIHAFASFWESEVARIGEPGAKGWNTGKSSELEATTVDAQTPIERENLFSSWSTEELRISRGARLPARTFDIVENDDPYRVVLWSDMEAFLAFFSNWKDKNAMVESFLKFCYLPSLNTYHFPTMKNAGDDAFLRTELISLSGSSVTSLVTPSPESSEQATPLPLFNLAPLPSMLHSVDTLFGDSHWFQSLTTWKEMAKNEDAIINNEWVRRSLRLLVGRFPEDDNLAEVALAVEFVLNSSEARKYAKSLLKKRSSSLRLYNTFALMEARCGNFSTASHVWNTTFSMAPNLSEAQRLAFGALIRSWIWEYLASNRVEEAIKVLISAPHFTIDSQASSQQGEISISPAQRLATDRFIHECIDYAFLQQDIASFTAWTDLSALLHYLLAQYDLPSALKTYNSAFTTINSLNHKSWALELLHQSRSHLLWYHITHKRTTYKPAYIREHLLESTTLFPNNTIFLSLFTWNETRFRIDERIRDVFLHASTPSPTSPSSSIAPSTARQTKDRSVSAYLLTILIELARPVYSGSTIHSCRATFERVLSPSPSSSSMAASPSLWKLYIFFELYRAKDRAAAQKVFYRALRACPWVKDLIMLAFGTSLFDADTDADKGIDVDDDDDWWWDLRKVYNVLIDKELRVHVEIGDGVFEEAERGWVEKQERRKALEEKEKSNGKTKDRKGRTGRELVYLPDDVGGDVD